MISLYPFYGLLHSMVHLALRLFLPYMHTMLMPMLFDLSTVFENFKFQRPFFPVSVSVYICVRIPAHICIWKVHCCQPCCQSCWGNVLKTVFENCCDISKQDGLSFHHQLGECFKNVANQRSIWIEANTAVVDTLQL